MSQPSLESHVNFNLTCIIVGLKLPLKQKVSCLAIVSLSVLSIVAAAIRLDRLLWTAQHPDDLQCKEILVANCPDSAVAY